MIFKFTSFFVALCIIYISGILYILSFFYLDLRFQQFSLQTQSFLDGRADIIKTLDTVDINGKHYWPQNPFPSVLLIPGQLIVGPSFREPLGQLFLLPILTVFLYKLARLKHFNRQSSAWLVFAFLFGSVIINLALKPGSWYFSQIVATTLLTIFLFEFETRKRFFLLGIIEGLIIATRPTAGFIGLLVFGIIIHKIYKSKTKNSYFINLIFYVCPIILSVLLLIFFNYFRFNDPFFNTYQFADIEPEFARLREVGIFSIKHIPSNFYYYFLAPIIPVVDDLGHLQFPFVTYDPYGLSFFITSPFFIYSIRSLRSAGAKIKTYWLTLGVTLFCLLTYLAMGYATYGPRYTADFFPILFLLTLHAIKPPSLTRLHIIIILASASFNILMIITAFVLAK